MDAAASPAEATFGDLLRQCRQDAGLTQEDLAERTGLSVRGLSDLERGVRVIPRKDTLHLLIEALGLVGGERATLVAAAKRRSAPLFRRDANDRGAPDLPAPLTPFFGRDGEIASVSELLQRDDVRLVTLTGPGGVGKTRLALQVAQELASSFPDGVRFIDLAAIREPSLVVTTIAQSFGLREMGGRPLAERLASLLRDKRMLLLLDNFEQVAEAAPEVIELLVACSHLTVLVTSRSVLHVSGERAFPVPPLALPNAEQNRSITQLAASEAVRLFVDRAQAVFPHFALDAANAPTVAAICRRLDGLPLAITLAAARIGHLSPAALLERLEQRLPMLTGGPRDQPDRLRTMGDAIAWSHDLLSLDEQRLFRRLAIFAGGFTLEAAEYVDEDGSASVLDGLASLVNGSLVWQDMRTETQRYHMLETIREYGLERLAASGDEAVARRRHGEWCLALAERSHVALPGPAQRMWLERTDADHDNIRQALSWLLEQGEAERAQRLTASLYRFWYVHGYLSEGRAWSERALAGMPATPDAVRAGALLAAGWMTWAQGDYPRAVERVQEGLTTFRTSDHTGGIAESLYVLGMVAKDRDDYDRATHLLTEALGLYRLQGATFWVGFVLNALGLVAYEQGDLEAARALFSEALALSRTVGKTHGSGFTLTNLGKLALAEGDIGRAAAHYRESLALWQVHGDKMSVAGCLRGLANVAVVAGRFDEAARLFGAAEALRERIGLPQARHHAHYEAAVRQCRAALGEEQLSARWQAGRALPFETAMAMAIGTGGPEMVGQDAPAERTIDSATIAPNDVR